MTIRFLILLLTLGVALAGPPAPEAAEPALSPAEVDQLVHRLGSPDYADREAATRALLDLGAPALDALRRAARHPDEEVRTRASRLVRQIEQRAASARLLAPQRIRLAYNNAPVTAVVEDLAQKTGLRIHLEGDTARLAGRTVTMDTGERTLWEAFDRVCTVAGLVERVPPPRPRETIAAVQTIRTIGNRTYIEDDRGEDEEDRGLILADGPPVRVPTCYAGAVRVRALPAAGRAEAKQADGELAVVLDVTTEPRLRWQRVVRVRVDRAVDDQGQVLTQLSKFDREPLRLVPPQGRGRWGAAVPPGIDLPEPPGTVRRTTVWLRAGPRPARALTELTGVLSAQVQAPPRPLMTVPDVLRSAGAVVTSPAGGSLRVVEVRRLDDGQVRWRIHLTAPLTRPGLVLVNGRLIGEVEESVEATAANFTLHDAQGRPLAITGEAGTELTGAGRYTQQFELTYTPAPGRGEPATLVYTGWTTAILDVPFTLEDVPLP